MCRCGLFLFEVVVFEPVSEIVTDCLSQFIGIGAEKPVERIGFKPQSEPVELMCNLTRSSERNNLVKRFRLIFSRKNIADVLIENTHDGV